ncbi:DUF7380 domain-containing protein [Frigoribacterium faeni]|uniref:DUF7380 domain-containing protein n=1 Tax=Frigoribacterium faeni TaxID=145483 RepID=UPI0040403A83
MPMIRSSGSQTATPSDFTAAELGLLRYVFESDADPPLRVRCADLCWLRSVPRHAGLGFTLLAISL